MWVPVASGHFHPRCIAALNAAQCTGAGEDTKGTLEIPTHGGDIGQTLLAPPAVQPVSWRRDGSFARCTNGARRRYDCGVAAGVRSIREAFRSSYDDHRLANAVRGQSDLRASQAGAVA